MKIYTIESYCKEFNYFKHYLDHMVIQERDLEIIDRYSQEELKEYILNAKRSIYDLLNDRVFIADFKEKDKRIRYYSHPFTLFSMADPAGKHYRFSIYPYHECFEHQYDFVARNSKTVKINGEDKIYGNIGDFVKTDYDYEDNVKNCLDFYIKYMTDRLRNIRS